MNRPQVSLHIKILANTIFVVLVLLVGLHLLPREAYAAPAWNLSGTSYDSVVRSVEAKTQGAFFKSDGTVLYVASGDGSPLVRQYPLSSAWNLSTLGATTGSFSLSGSGAYWPQGLFFKSDGTRMYVVRDYSSDTVHQYDLATPWNITTATAAGSVSISSQANFSSGVFFKSDGTKMYVSDSGTERLYQYTLSSAWDVTTATYDSISLSFFSLFSVSDTRDISFKSDGSVVFFVGTNGSGSAIAGQVSLPNAWDISTTSSIASISINTQASDPRSMFIGNAGTKLYVSSGFTSSSLYQYTIASSDSTPPLVSITAPTNDATVSGLVTITASATDDVAVAGVTFYVDGTQVGSEDTTSPYSVTWNSLVSTSTTKSIQAVARDESSNYATSTAVSVTLTNTPTVSSVATTTATSTATVSWTSAQLGSTRLFFGISNAFASSTPESDTDTRVTSHEVDLSGLLSCSVFRYQAVSTTEGGEVSTSTESVFTTTGCTGDSVASSHSESGISTLSGGTLAHENLTLIVPVSFTATTSSASFQALTLDTDAFVASAGVPSNKTRVSSIYHLKSFSDVSTALTSFDESLTVTISYDDSDISGLDESALAIHRYNGTVWSELSSCTVDTVANTVSCMTAEFSEFSIFGEQLQAVDTSRSRSTGSVSTSAIKRKIDYLLDNQKFEDAQVLLEKWNEKFSVTERVSFGLKLDVPILATATDDQSVNTFIRDLYVGMIGEDVKSLQTFLLGKGFSIPAGATGYFGKETKAALSDFQIAYGIDPSEGYFGFITREFVAQGLLMRVATPVLTPIFPRNLTGGDTGEDVKLLQTFLLRKGFSIPAGATGYFGKETKAALSDFQIANALYPPQGYFGPVTKNRIGEMFELQ